MEISENSETILRRSKHCYDKGNRMITVNTKKKYIEYDRKIIKIKYKQMWLSVLFVFYFLQQFWLVT